MAKASWIEKIQSNLQNLTTIEKTLGIITLAPTVGALAEKIPIFGSLGLLIKNALGLGTTPTTANTPITATPTTPITSKKITLYQKFIKGL